MHYLEHLSTSSLSNNLQMMRNSSHIASPEDYCGNLKFDVASPIDIDSRFITLHNTSSNTSLRVILSILASKSFSLHPLHNKSCGSFVGKKIDGIESLLDSSLWEQTCPE